MISRRTAVAGAAATFASIGFVRNPARAAQYEYKFAHNQPVSHPIHVYTVEMWANVARETNGRLVVQTFPSGTLGGDDALMSQLRAGAIQFLCYNAGFATSLAPSVGLENVAFAFKDEATALAAMDGALGQYIAKELTSKGLFTFPKLFSLGFRQMTTSNKPINKADDMVGLKMRVPTIKAWIDLFKALGTSPTPISSNEIYTALQTHIVDGQENPYGIIETFKFYEVQKYLSETNHLWTGQTFFANNDVWTALPPDIRAIVLRNADKAAVQERRSAALLNEATKEKLGRLGLILIKPDVASFRVKLAPYYTAMKAQYSPLEWGLLEQYSGKLG